MLFLQCFYIAEIGISSSDMWNNLQPIKEKTCFVLDCIKIPKDKKCTYLSLVVDNVSSAFENTPYT